MFKSIYLYTQTQVYQRNFNNSKKRYSVQDKFELQIFKKKIICFFSEYYDFRI